jgi:hypothetical protein
MKIISANWLVKVLSCEREELDDVRRVRIVSPQSVQLLVQTDSS